MKKREFKYTGLAWQERAMFALIGQVHQALDIRVRVSDVAAWMGRSKPAAKRHLDKWVKEGKLSRVKYRNRHEYQLNDEIFGNYLDGVYKPDYRAYMSFEGRSTYE